MRVLSIIHDDSGTGVFGEVVVERGHEHVEWRIDLESQPVDSFEALLVFGGTQNTHEEDAFPWLLDERALIRRCLVEEVPIFGLCLGGQLLAKVLHTPVTRLREPEIGWNTVERLPGSDGDAVFGEFPDRFNSFQWHYYEFVLPANAVPLLSSAACLQGYRAGDRAWGVQFHPEVRRGILQNWFDVSRESGAAVDFDALEADTDRKVERWNELGREMCTRFLLVAEA